jgi:hypothetical protein
MSLRTAFPTRSVQLRIVSPNLAVRGQAASEFLAGSVWCQRRKLRPVSEVACPRPASRPVSFFSPASSPVAYAFPRSVLSHAFAALNRTVAELKCKRLARRFANATQSGIR